MHRTLDLVFKEPRLAPKGGLLDYSWCSSLSTPAPCTATALTFRYKEQPRPRRGTNFIDEPRRTVNPQCAATVHPPFALARKVAARFPRPPEVRGVAFVTTQRSRWGSYSSATGTIRLNAVLRQMPRWVLEAVVAHELAHAVHLGHSDAFWALVRRVCPGTDRANAFLEGVSWLAGSWQRLPPVERALLVPTPGEEDPV